MDGKSVGTISVQGSSRWKVYVDGAANQVILVEDLSKEDGVKNGMVQIHQVRMGPSWMDPIVGFLKDDTLLEEKSESEKIQRKAPRF